MEGYQSQGCVIGEDSGNSGLELPACVEGLELGVSAKMGSTNEHAGDGALAGLLLKGGLDGVAVGHFVELNKLEFNALSVQQARGLNAERAPTLRVHDNLVACDILVDHITEVLGHFSIFLCGRLFVFFPVFTEEFFVDSTFWVFLLLYLERRVVLVRDTHEALGYRHESFRSGHSKDHAATEVAPVVVAHEDLLHFDSCVDKELYGIRHAFHLLILHHCLHHLDWSDHRFSIRGQTRVTFRLFTGVVIVSIVVVPDHHACFEPINELREIRNSQYFFAHKQAYCSCTNLVHFL